MDEVGITNGCAMVEVPKRSSRNVTVHSAMELRCGGLSGFRGTDLAGLVVAVVAMDKHEGSAPARLCKEMLGKIQEMMRQRVHRRARQAFRARVIRPVDNQRLSDYVFARNKTPIAAVQRIVAIVAHCE